MEMKIALVCGAGGFIGSHLVKRLNREEFRECLSLGACDTVTGRRMWV